MPILRGHLGRGLQIFAVDEQRDFSLAPLDLELCILILPWYSKVSIGIYMEGLVGRDPYFYREPPGFEPLQFSRWDQSRLLYPKTNLVDAYYSSRICSLMVHCRCKAGLQAE
jgi:hypothetical protein